MLDSVAFSGNSSAAVTVGSVSLTGGLASFGASQAVDYISFPWGSDPALSPNVTTGVSLEMWLSVTNIEFVPGSMLHLFEFGDGTCGGNSLGLAVGSDGNFQVFLEMIDVK